MIFSKLNFRSSFLSFAVLPNIYRDASGFDKTNKEDDDDEGSGWKRLKKMYSLDNKGLPSPQFESISEVALTAFFVGFVGGGILDAKETYLNFIESNKLTGFKSHFEAKRKLQDVMMITLMKGGWKRAWRLSLLTGSIVTVLFSLEAFKGNTSITDFSLAAAISCGLYKFPHGPKPFISGFAVGGALGTVAGMLTVGLFKLTGMSLQDIYKWDANRLDKVLEKEHAGYEKAREEEFTGILAYRRGPTLLTNDSLQDEADSGSVEIKTASSSKREIEIETVSTDKIEGNENVNDGRSGSVSMDDHQDMDESGDTEDK